MAVRAAPKILTILRLAGVRAGRIVELGTGGGHLAAALDRAGDEVHGLGASPAMIQRARARVVAHADGAKTTPREARTTSA